MPIPSSIADLSLTAGSNSPAGSESPSTIDDYLRVYASYIALLRDQRVSVNETTQTIASATTTDIGAATSNVVIISGTTTITGLGTVAAGARRSVRFSGILILTHNPVGLILPGGANITTAAGDCAEFRSLGSGSWVCTSFSPASGNYYRTNILGTVSQSSGVPTGALIEAGSNASGNFVKFADGTMICTRLVNLGSVAVTAAVGSLFNAISGALPYAATFIASPDVTIKVVAPSGAMWASGGSTFPTASGTQPFAILSPTSTTATIAVQVLAIGRWF